MGDVADKKKRKLASWLGKCYSCKTVYEVTGVGPEYLISCNLCYPKQNTVGHFSAERVAEMVEPAHD